MNTRDILVIGTSAGGVNALQDLFNQLPGDLPAAIFVVLHTRPESHSRLPEILQRHTKLRIAHAQDREPIEIGRVYIAPPNYHLLVEAGHVHLSLGPKENRTRPAINPLFRSAALAYGPRVIGALLTGLLDDGTLGLWEIKRRGGIAVVQDPQDTQFAQMPARALENVSTDYCVPMKEMGALLKSLVIEVIAHVPMPSEVIMNGEKTSLTCPECSGPVTRHQFGQLFEYQGRVGHRYSPQSMVAAHQETEERLLWSALEYLEEGADLLAQAGPHTATLSRESMEAAIRDRRQLAKTIRESIQNRRAASTVQESSGDDT